MSQKQIVSYPARLLLRPSNEVEVFDEALTRLAHDMFETMYAAPGVGLAAPQVGLSLRFFVMDCDGVRLVAANPRILDCGGEDLRDEGCLSLRGESAVIKRPTWVRMRAQDAEGNSFEKEASGIAARCMFHETDHCDGILYIKYLSPLKRELLVKRFLKSVSNTDPQK